MKKFLLSLFVWASLWLAVPCQAQNYDFSAVAPSGQTLYYSYYSYNGEGVSVVGSPTAVSGDLIIPDSVSYNNIVYPVINIGFQAFYNHCSALTNVILPNTVTAIESGAFWNCSSLTSIVLPDSITDIGYSAFHGCSSLTGNLFIPKTLTSIGEDAFRKGSANLDSIIVSPENPVYDSRDGCNALIHTATNALILGCHNTVIPNNITAIGNYAFWNCFSLASVTIPNSVTYIGNYAFYSCSSLTSVSIPNSVTSIAPSTFENCTSLTNVTIPNSVTSIGNSAFKNCSSLTSVIIPNSVTSIGNSAFKNCSSLISVSIPNSVTSIAISTFENCSSLTSVIIPNSVTSIKYSAFSYCTSLTNVTIPNSVTSIGNSAFSYCTSLTNVTIPNSVTSIGYAAFRNCTSLTNVTIPSSVTSIEEYAFENCSSLTSVTIPSSVNSIESSAFFMASIDTLTVYWISPICQWFGVEVITVNIPCGTTANYQNVWGDINYHEPSADVALTVSSSHTERGTASIIQQNGNDVRCTDSVAVIQATANYGYYFLHWDNGDTASLDTLHLLGDSSIVAVFEKNQYVLSISSNDPSMGSVTGNGTYEYLDTVTISAVTTAAHCHFVQWSDGVTDTSRTIVVTENLTLTAIFAFDLFHVELTVNDPNFGYVTGNGDYPYGSLVCANAFPYSGYYLREWSNGETSASFSFTLTQDTSFTAVFSPKINPSLCMVTVQDDHNVLLWEKEEPVTSYNVYREGNTSGVYDLIATVPYESLSSWTDTSSSPRTRSYRYKLSATDLYGHEADMSNLHKTMHLTINQGIGNQWNLVWTEYEGTDYTTYVIYRGTNASNIQQIDVMPSGGNTTYTDVTAPAGDVYYQVGIMLSSPCNPTKSDFIVRSNVATNSTIGIEDIVMADLQVYARDGQIIVSCGSEIKEVEVYDMLGKLLKRQSVAGNNTVINASDLADGVYVVRINTPNGTLSRKVMNKRP